MLTIERQSGWTFKGSNTGGIGAGPVSAEGGEIFLADPQGALHSLQFGSVGGGFTLGAKLPKITPMIAPSLAPNTGDVFIASGFSGDGELEEEDFHGICSYVEVSAGAFIGYSGVVLCAGIQPDSMGPDIVQMLSPFVYKVVDDFVAPGYIWDKFQNSCKAVICMRGWDAGVQAGATAGQFLGVMG